MFLQLQRDTEWDLVIKCQGLGVSVLEQSFLKPLNRSEAQLPQVFFISDLEHPTQVCDSVSTNELFKTRILKLYCIY